MIKTHLYLDTRAAGDSAPLKLAVSKRKQTSLLSLGISVRPDQWDRRGQKVIKHPHRENLNTVLAGYIFKANSHIQELILSGEAATLTARDIRDRLERLFHGKESGYALKDYWGKVASKTTGKTAQGYDTAWKAVCKADPHAPTRRLENLTVEWVEKIDTYVSDNYAQNTRNIYLWKLKLVLSSAVKEGLISSNPMENIRFKAAATRKRNLSKEQMRIFLSSPVENEVERTALDFFRFSFYARAMNPIDIWKATPENIYNGRLYYDRSKTGKKYSVAIEKELKELLKTYGNDKYLFAKSHDLKTPGAFFSSVNYGLHKRAERLGLPKVSMYWCRHTFASLALELGFTMDLISASLGHSMGGAAITSVYTSVKDIQIDKLARKVYNYVKNK